MGNVTGEEAEVKNKKKLHQVAEIMDPVYFFSYTSCAWICLAE